MPVDLCGNNERGTAESSFAIGNGKSVIEEILSASISSGSRSPNQTIDGTSCSPAACSSKVVLTASSLQSDEVILLIHR